MNSRTSMRRIRRCRNSSTRRSTRYVDEWEEAGIFPAHELFKKMGNLGFLGINKPVEVRRHGARLLLRHGVRRRARPHPLRRRADGDRRADRHGDAGAGPLRLRRAVRRNSWRRRSPATMSPASASPKSAPAPTSPRSRPRRARTAATTSSTAARCGPPTARRPTGCACSPTPATARRTATSR